LSTIKKGRWPTKKKQRLSPIQEWCRPQRSIMKFPKEKLQLRQSED
jgi:hypothetical protein